MLSLCRTAACLFRTPAICFGAFISLRRRIDVGKIKIINKSRYSVRVVVEVLLYQPMRQCSYSSTSTAFQVSSTYRVRVLALANIRQVPANSTTRKELLLCVGACRMPHGVTTARPPMIFLTLFAPKKSLTTLRVLYV